MAFPFLEGNWPSEAVMVVPDFLFQIDDGILVVGLEGNGRLRRKVFIIGLLLGERIIDLGTLGGDPDKVVQLTVFLHAAQVMNKFIIEI